MNLPQEKQCLINPEFYQFINNEVLPKTSLNNDNFWADLNNLINDFSHSNTVLLNTRQQMQNKINQWHLEHPQSSDFSPQASQAAYREFLQSIGYLTPMVDDFTIETENVDPEISTMAGPQLVVPVSNARFALNAANARWGSLYDAFYGTDIIDNSGELSNTKAFNPQRGQAVIDNAKDFLDEQFPLNSGSHHDVTSYLVYYQHLLAFFADGSECGLKDPCQFVAFDGSKNSPTYLLLKNNGLHVGLHIDRTGKIGATDNAGIDDIQMESALTTIMDFEDSVSTVDSNDKVEAYRNWLGLMRGDLEVTFTKDNQAVQRKLNYDRNFTAKSGGAYRVPGRSVLLVRNVGHLMGTDLIQDIDGNNAPEGIIDGVVTALIGSLDLQKSEHDCFRNSRSGSIYIVKPKLHGPEEVRFTCDLFSRIELMLNLPKDTLKLGIMDEERRTTVNLKQCIYEAKSRVVFINTGFLDRTGDEIHTSMLAGAFYPKSGIKNEPWINAYENNNVEIGLRCGFSGKAQIGKGMWAMPDEMKQMMKDKIAHPKSGANTAWVPSPTAATLHALHYHRVNVFEQQNTILTRTPASLDSILTMPIMPADMTLTAEQIETELNNNVQGILGYVVRWIEMGIGCSKVPDINDIGLMEDRATLRISSQHISNWLMHNVCTQQQVNQVMERMAKVVDKQNEGVTGYQNMSPNTEKSLAFQAAKALILEGHKQPNGYTEPLLHEYRLLAKQQF
ncbi:malate synthase G [Psychromonas aquatilis]|uniref:Malate synthase G n=1 Tax=Psychromonas aquatilis TaxID=2005072 RepID=A0ABU9GTK6_9GAMM